jgi:hypothetical protein
MGRQGNPPICPNFIDSIRLIKRDFTVGKALLPILRVKGQTNLFPLRKFLGPAVKKIAAFHSQTDFLRGYINV